MPHLNLCQHRHWEVQCKLSSGTRGCHWKIALVGLITIHKVMQPVSKMLYGAICCYITATEMSSLRKHFHSVSFLGFVFAIRIKTCIGQKIIIVIVLTFEHK